MKVNTHEETRRDEDIFDQENNDSHNVPLFHEGISSETNKKHNSYSQGYSFLIRVFWFHFLSILKKLKKIERQERKIEVEDLPELEDHVKVQYTRSILKSKIEQLVELRSQEVTSTQFLRMLGMVFRYNVLGICGFVFLETLAKLSSPYCTIQLIDAVKEGQTSSAIIWIILLALSNFLGVTFDQNSWTKAQRLSAQLRLGLISILYDKISNLSTYSVKKANIGKIINIISSDFNSFENNGVYIFHCLLSPFALILSCFLLVSRLGYVGVIAIIFLALLFPLQKRVAQIASKYTILQTKERDQKTKIFCEMIQGIKIIKIYGWEKAFNTMINKLRNEELRYTLINQLQVFLEQTLSQNGPLFVALFCFLLADISSEDYLNISTIFSTIEVINFVSFNVMQNIGYGLNFLFDFKVLVERYMSIMSIENIQMKCIDLNQTFIEKPQNALVYMQNFSAYWSTDDLENKTPVLANIDLTIKKGEVVSLIGLIGSGKTSFLFAIMNEIPRYKGNFYATQNLSYVDQDPYILQGTIRDNIIFGKPFKREFYQQVIKACCLIEDFSLFSEKDLTIIGERGTNLSGGQKARICLARAVYADTELYLLDDPLSAVDSKVAKKLFDGVINGMLKDKTIILVTHQLHFALKCKKLAIFDKGQILVQGNPKTIDFSQTPLEKHIEQSCSDEDNEIEANQNDLLFEQQDNIDCEEDIIIVESTSSNDQKTNMSNQCTQQVSNNDIKSTKNWNKEEEFKVTLSTYINFIKINPNSLIFFGVVLLFVIQEILFTSLYKAFTFYESDITKQNFYIIIFSIFFSMFLFKYLQYSAMSYFILQSNKNLTQRMTTSLLQAKSNLFDEIPSGQIINKFSSDINILDKSLPEASISTLGGVLHFINMISTVIYFHNIFILPALVEVFVFTKWFGYIKTVLMRTKELDLQNKSPVFSFFQSTINGLLVINMYGQKQSFQKKMDTIMNNNIRTYDTFWFISRLFSIYMQYIGLIASTVGIVSVLFWFQQSYQQFAQTLTYFLLLTNFIHTTFKSFINMDIFMTSSERAHSIINLPKEDIDIQSIQEFNDKKVNTQTMDFVQIKTTSEEQNLFENNLDQDTVHINMETIQERSNVPEKSLRWPNKGELIFDRVYMRYKQQLEHVLKGVSFEALKSEKVAIVGRTGAGKSSIIQSLFRLCEIDSYSEEGDSRILYDKRNTKDLQLHQLRKNISIIPQTPFIFSGSISHNIDPFKEYSDEQVINVLKEAGLHEIISQLSEGIHTDMSDSSSIFSMGQKQLICLARAMLRKNKLMVLDEATANVDMDTDQKIQSLLKEKFKDTTIITIAHRLNTIADYDKIIVLDAGKVVEVNSPFKLLAHNEGDETITNNKTQFAQMVLQTGAKNAQQIFQLSKQSFIDKKI